MFVCFLEQTPVRDLGVHNEYWGLTKIIRCTEGQFNVLKTPSELILLSKAPRPDLPIIIYQSSISGCLELLSLGDQEMLSVA